MGPIAETAGYWKRAPRQATALLLLAAVAGCGANARDRGVSTVALSLKERGVLAGPLGSSLNDAALAKAADAEYRALEGGQTGVPVAWRVSDAVFGAVVPQQPFSVGPANCRRYSHSVTVSGQTRSASGTACRQEDGSWRPLT